MEILSKWFGKINMAVFTDKNISSMCGQSGLHNKLERLRETREVLAKYSDIIDDIILTTGFTATNLSSMLSGGGKGLSKGIEALARHKDDLALMIKEGLFDRKSISGMLNSSGMHLEESISSLVENKKKIKEIIDDGIFDRKSISSMLNRSGKYMATAIDALVSNKNRFKEVIDNGIFDDKALSSVLHGSGKDLAEGLDVIELNMPKLHKICVAGFKPTEISHRLNHVPVKKLQKTIDEIHDRILPEIKGKTEITNGRNLQIASRSKYAEKVSNPTASVGI